jgi:predicted component of type VI protein secretion system
MASVTTESLRSANRNLRTGLARLLPESNASPSLDPQDLSGLLTELLRAADCVRSIPPGFVADTELEEAISEYRNTVEQLAQILPRVHGRLLTEKARLEIAQAHVTAAAAWAQASTKTL